MVALSWDGMVPFASKQMPGSMVGRMVLTDLVVHGWDLARATDQPFHCADEVAETGYTFAAELADQGRTMSAFGPEVPVSASAPMLDRALGLCGRDPAWTPPTR
jgi:uncharacterized protein (TIGR03086 family)